MEESGREWEGGGQSKRDWAVIARRVAGHHPALRDGARRALTGELDPPQIIPFVFYVKRLHITCMAPLIGSHGVPPSRPPIAVWDL